MERATILEYDGILAEFVLQSFYNSLGHSDERRPCFILLRSRKVFLFPKLSVCMVKQSRFHINWSHEHLFRKLQINNRQGDLTICTPKKYSSRGTRVRWNMGRMHLWHTLEPEAGARDYVAPIHSLCRCGDSDTEWILGWASLLNR